MIRFWLKNTDWLKATAITLVASLLFTFVAPPFAQSSIWEERRKAVENINQKKEKTA